MASASVEQLQMWWRHGELLEIGKFTGAPSSIARLDRCRFGLDSSVPENIKYLLLSGKHEKPERAALRRFLDPNLPVIEFGGFIGVVSCVANKILSDPRKHVVIEANPAIVPLLVENRDRNRCAFTVLHRAIGYGAAEIRFNINENLLASSIQASSERFVTVATITLEKLLHDFGFGHCTLICDIEGGEVDLVRHESQILGERVSTILMEVHNKMLGDEVIDAMLRDLHRIGFHVRHRDWDTVVLQNSRPKKAPVLGAAKVLNSMG